MNIVRGLLFSALAAAAGAGLWVGIYAATGYSIGITAIIIGGLAGFGMGTGCAGRGGVPAGVLAAIITLVAVLGARMGVAHMYAAETVAEHAAITEEDAVLALAPDIYARFADDGVDMSEPDDDQEYPPEVLAAAARRWRLMGDFEREDFLTQLAAQRSQEAAVATSVLTGLSFIFGFGIMGLVCLGLAMSTAFKIASSSPAPKQPAEGDMTVDAVGPSTGPSTGQFGAFARLGPPADPQRATPSPTLNPTLQPLEQPPAERAA